MFKDEYQAAFSKVTASADTYRRVMRMKKEKKTRRISATVSKILIAAVMISLLTITASASEVIRNWFVPYFGGTEEMSQAQVEYIEENEQHIDESQTQNDWTIELRSAMSDGTKGYILLGVKAPENISLKELLDASKNEFVGPRNDFLPKSENTVLSCSAGLVATIGSNWREDGDCLDNTLSYVIDVTPDKAFSKTDPFGSDVEWTIHIEDIVRGFPEQKLVAEGIWDFSFRFTKEDRELELLDAAVKVQALAMLPDGTEVMKAVTIKSVKLRAFGITVSYGDPDDGLDYDRTSVDFTYTLSGSEPEKDPWLIVMRDGTERELSDAGVNPVERYGYLEVDAPVILESVDHILLSDGTKLPMPELS